MDLAIGVMVGGAFNSLVKSFVDDILTPFVGVFLGKTSVSNWKLVFELPIVSDGDTPEKVIISYGKFFQATMDFLILAVVIYTLFRVVETIRLRAENPKDTTVPTPKDLELLSEIRDSLNTIKNNTSTNQENR